MEKSDSFLLREKYYEMGYGLINITDLCEAELGISGWCNSFNEPDEMIYHVRIVYRGEIIANLTDQGMEIIDDDKHVTYTNEDGDFIIFRVVPLEKD